MVTQPTKEHRLFARSNSANAAMRLLSSLYRFLAHSHFAVACQLVSPLNSDVPRSSYDHHHGDVGSVRCHRSNPHSQPSLLLPTL
jgi:hypothetical protein